MPSTHSKISQKLTLFVLLFCSLSLLAAQSPGELRQQWQDAKNDSSTIAALQQLCRAYGDSKLDSALYFCKLARELSQEKGTPEDYVRSLWKTAAVMGRTGNHDRELALNLEALEIAQETGDSSLFPSAYMQVGNAHYRVGNNELAAQNYQISLRFAEARGETRQMAGTLNNLGNIFMQNEELDSAEAYFEQARQINIQANNQSWLAINLYNLGKVQGQRGNYPEALELFERTMDIRKSTHSVSGEAAAHKMMGVTYQKWGKYQKAEFHLQKSMELYASYQGRPGLKDVNMALSELYEAQGNHRKALDHFRLSTDIRDSIQDEDMRNKLAYAQVNFDFEQQERDRLLNQKEKELIQQQKLNRTTRGLFIALLGVVILFGVGFVLVKRSRDQKRDNLLLEKLVAERTADLHQANAELNQFIYKSSHDIRGPLSSVRGLAQLADKVEEVRDLRTYLGMIDQKAEHLEGILGRLTETIGMTEKEIQREKVELYTLAESVWEKLANEKGADTVKFENQIKPGTELTTDKEFLEVILYNLFQNAIWFRTQEGGQAFCRITALTAGDCIRISIADNGTGLSPEMQQKVWEMFYKAHTYSSGSGLGLYIVQKAAKRLNGSAELVSLEGQGTEVTVELPIG